MGKNFQVSSYIILSEFLLNDFSCSKTAKKLGLETNAVEQTIRRFNRRFNLNFRKESDLATDKAKAIISYANTLSEEYSRLNLENY